MNAMSWALVALGGGAGACARQLLSLWLNPVFAPLPLGTLAANLSGGYLMGLILGLVNLAGGVPAEIRLLLATGFLGGLTTFSTFSAEVSALLIQGRWAWAAGTVTVHAAGSILLTLAGVATVQATLALWRG